MIEGLNLFRQRKLEESHLENSIQIELPPVYKVFIESYIVKRGAMIKNLYLDPRFNEKLEFLEQNYKPDNGRLLVYDFFSVQEGLQVMKNAYPEDDAIHGMSLFPIGECSSNQILLVGTSKDNLDQIVLERTDSEKRFTYKANNVFEFIRGIEMTSSDSVNGLPIGTFYRNWDEDFWRVREKG